MRHKISKEEKKKKDQEITLKIKENSFKTTLRGIAQSEIDTQRSRKVKSLREIDGLREVAQSILFARLRAKSKIR